MRTIKGREFYHYMVVFCIPVLLVGLMIFGSRMVSARKEAQQLHLASLKQVAEALDVLKDRCDTIAEHAQNNGQMVSTGAEAGGEDFIAQWLSTNEDMSPFSVTLALYDRETRLIYQRDGAKDYGTLEAQIGHLSASLTGLYMRLNQANQQQSLMLGQSSSYGMAYLYPLSNEQMEVSRCLCIMIPNTTVMEIYSSFFDPDLAALAITSPSGEPLMMNAPFDRAELRNFRSLSGTGVIQENKNAPVLHYISPQSRQRYFVSMPATAFYNYIAEPYQLLPLILLCVLAGGLLAVMISRVHQRHLQAACDENESLTDALNERVQIIRGLVLNKLIDGSIKDEATIRYNLQCASLHMDRAAFCLAVISFGPDCDLEALQEQVAALCQQPRKAEMSCYCVMRPEDNQLVVLANLEDAAATEIVAEEVGKWMQHVQPQPLAVGVSRVHHHIHTLNDALVEARVAMLEHMAEQSPGLFRFESSYAVKESLSHLTVEKALITESIRNGSEAMLTKHVNRLFDRIACEVENPQVEACLCYNVIHMCAELQDSCGFPLEGSEIAELCAYQSTEQLRVQIRERLIHLYTQTRQQVSETINASKYSLLDFVQAHFSEPALSLTMLAEQFHLTQSYISKLFKDETGQTFISYVRQLRVRYVKGELKDTDKPIKDIVQEAGYADVANFSRMFKAMEGMTPGEYRRIAKG